MPEMPMGDFILSPTAPEFSVGEVSAILEIPRRKGALWIEQGVIQPTIGDMGKGHQRHFSFVDLLKICGIAQLADWMIAPRFLRALGDVLSIVEVFAAEWKPPISITQMRAAFPSSLAMGQSPDGRVAMHPYSAESSFGVPLFLVFQYEMILDDVLLRVWKHRPDFFRH